MKEDLHILHLARLVGKNSFGIGPVVLGLAHAQQAMGCQVEIWSYDSETEAREMENHYGLNGHTIRCFSTIGPRWLGYSPYMERELVARADKFDVVHQHGFWTAILHATNRWRAVSEGPMVIAPHGTLDRWALRRSVWKKRLALLLYGQRNLREASCLHALSMMEADSFRLFELKNPIAVIPNGISEDWLQGHGEASAFQHDLNLPDGIRIMLFLGRITPKKGLPMLVRAMQTIRSRLGGWRLIIAGVDEFGHQQEVESLVRRLNMNGVVQFIGPLYGQNKRDAFAAADLFVLTSHSEGAPVTILEALGAGVPVLVTRASPWKELHTNHCGWWVDISTESIAEALEGAINIPKETLHEMGQRGRELVYAHYTWHKVARKTLLLYEWLLWRHQQPDFVLLD